MTVSKSNNINKNKNHHHHHHQCCLNQTVKLYCKNGAKLFFFFFFSNSKNGKHDKTMETYLGSNMMISQNEAIKN